MRACNRCGAVHALTDYYKNKASKDGRLGICKACVDVVRKAYTAANAERIAERMKAYHATNRDELLQKQREYKTANRAALAAKKRAKATGFDPALFAATAQHQGHCCAICKIAFRNVGKQQMHADHCHTTGRPRGVLCQTCNTALGKFGDSAELLRSAIAYLESPPADEAMKTRRAVA